MGERTVALGPQRARQNTAGPLARATRHARAAVEVPSPLRGKSEHEKSPVERGGAYRPADGCGQRPAVHARPGQSRLLYRRRRRPELAAPEQQLQLQHRLRGRRQGRLRLRRPARRVGRHLPQQPGQRHRAIRHRLRQRHRPDQPGLGDGQPAVRLRAGRHHHALRRRWRRHRLHRSLAVAGLHHVLHPVRLSGHRRPRLEHRPELPRQPRRPLLRHDQSAAPPTPTTISA